MVYKVLYVLLRVMSDSRAHADCCQGQTLGNFLANLKYWVLAGLVILAAYTLRGPY